VVVLVRYSEVAIKRGSVRREMEALLVRSIREAAAGCGEVKFRLEPGRIFVYATTNAWPRPRLGSSASSP